ncbi:Coiled-coil domain-containing protein 57 [Nibea albiflora]|uniref:Coiled-coil domain-containing protein 57 n=1 Tax=Nibea albiflora TaxID=240163 RepID=A0ACB7F3H7_NIBAL|nr:Coiled-coil domain-containing protein 57 [Nibea albiflora]
MAAAFDSELRQQEHEFNLTIDEVCAVVLSHDLKVKLLSNENKVHCQAHLQTLEALKASQKFCQQIQTQLQHKEQEVKDLNAVKDYRIKELEGELKQMETKLKDSEDNQIKKYENVIQALKKCDSQLEAQFQAHTEQLQKTEKHLVKLQKKVYKQQLSDGLKREKGLEQMRVQVELEWQNRFEDMKAEHYLSNEQVLHDLTKTREQVDSMASEEISRLQKQNNILRAVVTQMRKDMEGLSHPLPHPQTQPQASSPQPVQCQGAPAQTVTGPPPQSTDISTNVSSAGGVCLEKHASALTKQEIRVAHVLDQLQEENPHLRQHQASGPMSGGLFVNVQGAKSNPPLLHTRLKQAAFCIARLSREKQQLIEMCNRLRGQINTARLNGTVTNTHRHYMEAPLHTKPLNLQVSKRLWNTI